MQKTSYSNVKFEEQKSFRNRHLKALRNAEHYLLLALKEYEESKNKNVFLHTIRDIAEAQFKCYDIVQRMRLSKR